MSLIHSSRYEKKILKIHSLKQDGHSRLLEEEEAFYLINKNLISFLFYNFSRLLTLFSYDLLLN